MRTERVTFAGHAGDRLAARLDLPDRAPRVFALFAHCFTCGKDIAAARRIAERLTENGVGVLRFDFTGLGHSQGEFANTTFQSNVDDLERAARWLADTHAAPQLLIGHSLGGAAVLAAAPRIDAAKAVVVIGAPADPGHVLHNLGASVQEILDRGEAEVALGGRKFRIGRGFVEDVASTALVDIVGSMRKALLVMHAPRDQIVGIENATDIFAAAKHPKSFVTLDSADHLVSDDRDAIYVADVIAAWASRYLKRQPLPPRDDADLGGAVRSSEATADGFLQDIYVGRRHLLADEPKSVGGSDLGPGPYDYLCAALAACTSMTIRLYARKKGVALDHVAVDVSHSRIHAADCADCEQRDGRIDQFERRIRLTGALSADERAKLLEIADKCPVHRTLENEIKVRTALIE